jgi:3'-5' exoribonuclease
MKTQFVQSLQEGDVINDYFVAVRKDLREQPHGGKFLGMVFKDRSGEIGGIMWNGAAGAARTFEQGDVVNVRGTVASHQERLQIRVDQIVALCEKDYDMGDLIASTGDVDTGWESYRETLLSVKNPWLHALLEQFLSDEELMARLKVASAGRKWHHSARGGLVQHCREMTAIAMTMCELFPILDRDLLIAAIFLHDIGKVDEMNHGLVIEYTTPGKLVGHLSLGAEMVHAKIAQVPDFPRDLTLQLLHCILSHHGEMSHGSPVVPKTMEALVLYHCDNMDAQADAFLRIIEESRGRGQVWSDYIPSIDRQVWTKER